jgi:hypothetical protein
MEEIFVDAVNDAKDIWSEEYSNDTNEEILHYFAHVTNHYLCLVKSLKVLL